MEGASTGSFIPKRGANPKTRKPLNRRVYIFGYIAYVLFFGTLLCAAGVFALNLQANNTLEEYIFAVESAQESFDRNRITQLSALHQRIRTAEHLMNTHMAPSQLFAGLESAVLQSVQLTSFSYSKTSANKATLSVEGSVDDFDSLLYQRSVLEDSAELADAAMTAVTFGSSGSTLADGEAAIEATTGNEISFTAQKDYSVSELAYVPSVTPVPIQATETNSANTTAPAEVPEPVPDSGADAEVDRLRGELFGDS